MPDLHSGRVALYICPLCADLSCDTVGCRIEFTPDTVTWHDFCWDGNGGNPDIEPDKDDEPTRITGLDTFTFSRKEYEQLFHGLL